MSSSCRVEDERLIRSSRCKDVMVNQPMAVTMYLAVRPQHRWILPVSGRVIPQQHTSHIYISKTLHRLMRPVLVAACPHFKIHGMENKGCSGYLSAFSTEGEPCWPPQAPSTACTYNLSLSSLFWLCHWLDASVTWLLDTSPHSIFAFLPLQCNLHSLQELI